MLTDEEIDQAIADMVAAGVKPTRSALRIRLASAQRRIDERLDRWRVEQGNLTADDAEPLDEEPVGPVPILDLRHDDTPIDAELFPLFAMGASRGLIFQACLDDLRMIEAHVIGYLSKVHTLRSGHTTAAQRALDPSLDPGLAAELIDNQAPLHGALQDIRVFVHEA